MRWLDLPIPSSPHLPGLHPLVAQTLSRRGLSAPVDVEAFLHPELYNQSPSSSLPGVEAAVERITAAIRSRQQICVWGDFDVDGQTATTLLVQVINSLGGNATYHIPVRSREGHGVNLSSLKDVVDLGAQLILTCDTGITALQAAEYLRNRGVDMIITDHHDLPPHLPPALAIVNPKMLPAEHPLATLAGVGVAYKLAEALLQEFPGSMPPSDLLDLTALGLVADLALLKNDTRTLVQLGLDILRSTPRLGLQTMYKLAELQPETINESHISFTIAPRLNAIGRLGDANPIVDFLLTGDPDRTRVLATQLENYNAQRRLLTGQVTQAAEALLHADPSLLAAPILILGHPAWPGGVVGIAASHLVERYGKPAIVFSTPEGEPAHGSARSVEGLNITEAIAAQSDLLLTYGGHPMAAGLSLRPENLPSFTRRMAGTVEAYLGHTLAEESALPIDSWIELTDLTLSLASAIEQISPFGPGNSGVVLACRRLTLQNAAFLGRNKEHRKLTISDQSGNSQQVVWWDGGSEALPENLFDLAFTMRATNWQGRCRIQLEFVDFRVAESEDSLVYSKRQVEIMDFRTSKDFQQILSKSKEMPSTILWAEGSEKNRVGGKDRTELSPADLLVIWTIPPSHEELLAAVEIVHPKTIWLVAAHPSEEIAETFISRLTGLSKYRISHHNGHVSLPQLAAAAGQRLVTVKKGLAWLSARGTIGVTVEKDDAVLLTTQASGIDPTSASRLWTEMQSLLSETAAYRAHFTQADKDMLIY